MKYKVTDIANFILTSSCTTVIQASRKLGISQPALSESIKRLESDLGYKLFYRSRSGISLTPSGSVYLDKAKTAMDGLDDLQNFDRPLSIFSRRKISIGCHSLVAQYTLPHAFMYLESKAPDFNFEIIHGLSRDIQYDVQKGKIDLGIVVNPLRVPDIVVTKLANDRVGLWHSKGNKNNDTIYCDQNILQTHTILKKLKQKPKKIISTTNFELIVQMVKRKLGLGIIPERAVKLLSPKLILLPNSPLYLDEICLVYRPEFGKNLAEKLTTDAIKSVFTEY